MIRKYRLLFSLLACLPSIVVAQTTQPDLTGANVVLVDLGGSPEGNYVLYTIKDGRIVHTTQIGEISFFGRSNDRLAAISMGGHNPDTSLVRVYDLPGGNQIASYNLSDIFSGVLQQGAAETAIVEKNTLYFGAYQFPTNPAAERRPGGTGVFVKTDLTTGQTTVEPGGGALTRAGDFIIEGGQFNFQAYSIFESRFSKTIPKVGRERGVVWGSTVFVPQDGLYSYNVQGEFTRIAKESLDPTPDAQRQTWTIVRGVFAAKGLPKSVAEKTLVILSGPNLNGDLRGEPIEPALTFAKPSEQKITGTIKLPFTSTHRIFTTAKENIIAVVNAADGSIIKFDCATQKEVGRIALPPFPGRVRELTVQVVY